MKVYIFIFILVATTLHATVVTVPTDQPTIQAGIDSASVGDTVLVNSGTYYEHLVIDKTICLMGQAINTTIIDGSNSGDVIYISGNSVRVKNLTLTHAGSEQIYQSSWDAGIKIYVADSCIIEQCKFYSNGAAGIVWASSSHNRILLCDFTGSPAGIYAHELWETGPFEDNYGNIIRHNHFTGHSDAGIRFEHAVSIYHQSNVISCNIFAGNHVGISMIMSHENVVSYNNFNNNNSRGVVLSMCMGGGEFNQLHHNCFINNGSSSSQAAWAGEGTNYWYSPSDLEGNYWSDYTGSDANGDGIGDTPYEIESYGTEAYDPYPLMNPVDSDADSIIDSADNCIYIFNPDQNDADMDGVGDACCCVDRGNTDNTIGPGGPIDVGDLTYLVDYLFRNGGIPPCPEQGNVNGLTGPGGPIDISDITYLVDYLFKSGPEPPVCP